MSAILVLHGPNLNLLGQREPEIYGSLTLEEINRRLVEAGARLGVEVRTFQSNHEGELIDCLQEAPTWAAGAILNAAGYTHTSVALRDAVSAIAIRSSRSPFQRLRPRGFPPAFVADPVCKGSIAGFGWRSYLLALYALAEQNPDKTAA